MKWTRLVGGIGGAAVVVALMAWQGVAFVRERDALRAKVQKTQDAAKTFRLTAETEVGLRERERALIASTLGPDSETVDARLRAGLNQILSACGVSKPVVSAHSASPVRHPGAKAIELAGLSGREQISFATVTATAQGRGGYEQVLAAVATMASQTWVHRVEQVAITPASKDRTLFDMEVVVTTLFLPGRAPQAEAEEGAGGALWVGLDDAAQARLARLSRANPFTEPSVEVAVAPGPVSAPVAAPTAPVGPGYDQWRITALVEGRQGVELWLQRVGSGERRTIRPGETILDARFEGAKGGAKGGATAGEAALVRIGGTVFEVALGRTLADRVEVSQ